ncbi:MAG: hypothetical protein WKF40_07845 [Thermoleophilaceae bacterium]
MTSTPYNHYSLLRSTEDLFGLSHLGFAAKEGLAPFGADVYTRPGGEPRPPAIQSRQRLRVSVTPRRARLGRRTVFRFRVTARRGGRVRPVRGARIRIAHFGATRTGSAR